MHGETGGGASSRDTDRLRCAILGLVAEKLMLVCAGAFPAGLAGDVPDMVGGTG